MPAPPATPWGELPQSMRILLITPRATAGRWLVEVFATDDACDVDLIEAVGIVEGLSRLRAELFDAVLICHEPNQLDALSVLDSIRTGSTERQPILVLGEPPEAELAPFFYEAGADAYLCLENTTTRMLLWYVARARERQRLFEENRALSQTRSHQLRRNQDAAERLLAQQHELVAKFSDTCSASRGDTQLPESVVQHYRELLQTYVIMGGGNLAREMQRLVGMLRKYGMEGPRAFSLHVHVVESMIRDLGNRSAAHVFNRADLLFIEILLHLSRPSCRGLSLEGFANVGESDVGLSIEAPDEFRFAG